MSITNVSDRATGSISHDDHVSSTHEQASSHRPGIADRWVGLVGKLGDYKAESLTGIMRRYSDREQGAGSAEARHTAMVASAFNPNRLEQLASLTASSPYLSGTHLNLNDYLRNISHQVTARLHGNERQSEEALRELDSIVRRGPRERPDNDDTASVSQRSARERGNLFRQYGGSPHVPRPPAGMTPWEADQPELAHERYDPYADLSEEDREAAMAAQDELADAGRRNALELLGGHPAGRRHQHPRTPHLHQVEPTPTATTPSSMSSAVSESSDSASTGGSP